MSWPMMAAMFIGGILSLAILALVGMLILTGNRIPSELWAVLTSTVTAAIVGAARTDSKA